MEERKRKKTNGKGILGVRSTLKLFNFKGELWSDDEDGKNSDEDYSAPATKKDKDELAASAPIHGGAPAPKKRGRKPGPKPKNGKPLSPVKVKSLAKKGKKKEPYYEAETQELVEEAELSAFEELVETKFVPKNLTPLLAENDTLEVAVVMPDEILLRLFKEVIESDPKQTVHNLIRFSRVCEAWRGLLLRSPELWETLDLSDFSYSNVVPDLGAIQAESGETNILGGVRFLSLAGWTTISDDSLSALLDVVGPNLRGINLRECQISQTALNLLTEKCPVLERVDLTRTTYTSHNAADGKNGKQKKKTDSGAYPLQSTFIKNLVVSCGERLTHLSLAENKVQSFSVLVNAILESCPNLVLLDLSNVITSSATSISVDKLGASCPRLKILRLAYIALSAGHCSTGGGFPELEELVIPVQGEAHSVGHSDTVLTALTERAENLKLLDIRGSRNISVSCLIRIPSWNLAHLSLAYCTKLHTTDLELALGKWKDTLVDLDLSWNSNDDAVKAALDAIGSEENNQLRTVQLRGSAVSFPNVKKLVLNCKNMVSIDLQSCRGLPRGIKRTFEGNDFAKFCEDVKTGHYDFY